MDINHIFVELPNMYASIMRQSEIIVGSFIDGRDTLGVLIAEMTRNMILESKELEGQSQEDVKEHVKEKKDDIDSFIEGITKN